MRRTLKTLSVATLASALILLPLTVASADDRYAGSGTVTDAIGDAVATGVATGSQASAWDILAMKGQTHLDNDGVATIEALVDVRDSDFAVDSIRVRATFTVEGPRRDYIAVAETDMHAGTLTKTLTIDGQAVPCATLRSEGVGVDRIALYLPYSCMPGPGTVTTAARLVTVSRGGHGKTTDFVSATPGETMDYAAFRTSTMKEAAGDVDYGTRAGADRGAGRSADLLGAVATFAPSTQVLRIRATVLDLSTRRYHPAQKFSVDLRDGYGNDYGHLSLSPDYTGAGQHTITASGTGFTCTGVKVAALNARTDTVVLTIPRSCLRGGAVRATVTAATYDQSGGLLGTDSTKPSALIGLR